MEKSRELVKKTCFTKANITLAEPSPLEPKAQKRRDLDIGVVHKKNVHDEMEARSQKIWLGEKQRRRINENFREKKNRTRIYRGWGLPRKEITSLHEALALIEPNESGRDKKQERHSVIT